MQVPIDNNSYIEFFLISESTPFWVILLKANHGDITMDHGELDEDDRWHMRKQETNSEKLGIKLNIFFFRTDHAAMGHDHHAMLLETTTAGHDHSGHDHNGHGDGGHGKP